ncbi:MAG: hypothetical protein KR126chlam4_00796 [Candidatus Anoxychlamydiales bacterium]|nr:hypothetical protein [Candidatus Anoxychlamydiales bacterium]NGX40964.1 hypothetical protein [Candidatus Anoxychlamydiales bacterium]HEU63858.1 hypothetical protein [Chlamydiota bacterium]
MKKQTFLTNERLKYKFKSFFDLSNFGIKLAKERIAREDFVTLAEVIDELVKLPDEFEPQEF